MKNNKRTPKIWLFITGLLACSIVYCFLLFHTDAVYDIDISGYYNMTEEILKPISVADVIRQKEIAEINEPANGLNQSGGANTNPPGTNSDTDNIPDTPSSDIHTTGDGNIVESLGAFHMYDGPTVAGDGRYVDVRPAMDYHNEPYWNWWTNCRPGPWDSQLNGVRSRFTGLQDIAGTLCDANGVPLVGVGPAVMIPSIQFGYDDEVGEADMNYGTYIDVVVEKNGEERYCPFVVADCKAHTYPTWIAQSGYAARDGQVYFQDENGYGQMSTPSAYDINNTYPLGNVVVEICGCSNRPNDLYRGWHIKGIIVYD